MDELHQLLAVTPGMEDWDEDFELVRDAGLLPECGDLIQVAANSQCKLIHASLKEFLTGPELERMESIKEYWKVQQKQAQRTAETCLTFLNLRTFSQGPASTSEALEALVRRHPFLGYAVTQWGYHLSEVDDTAFQLADLHTLALEILRRDGSRELFRQLAVHLLQKGDSAYVSHTLA